MTPEKRSRLLRTEADKVIGLLHLRRACAPVGALIPTGSYFMDLMMYPDIDLYLPKTTSDRLLSIGAKLSKCPFVKKINYERGRDALARGFYLSPRIEYGNWGRPWKIDIWSLPDGVIRTKQAELDSLKSRMTSGQRDLILKTKFRLLTMEGRTPMYSGIFIYRAVVDLGILDFAGIVRFLKKNGIKI